LLIHSAIKQEVKTLQRRYRHKQYTRFVPKVSVLIFYLNIYWTHLKLQVISFNV